MTAAAYESLKNYLNVGTLRVIVDWPEFVHPHTPFDDPEWPDPTDLATLQALWERLPAPPFHSRSHADSYIPVVPLENMFKPQRGLLHLAMARYDYIKSANPRCENPPLYYGMVWRWFRCWLAFANAPDACIELGGRRTFEPGAPCPCDGNDRACQWCAGTGTIEESPFLDPALKDSPGPSLVIDHDVEFDFTRSFTCQVA